MTLQWKWDRGGNTIISQACISHDIRVHTLTWHTHTHTTVLHAINSCLEWGNRSPYRDCWQLLPLIMWLVCCFCWWGIFFPLCTVHSFLSESCKSTIAPFFYPMARPRWKSSTLHYSRLQSWRLPMLTEIFIIYFNFNFD